MRGDMEEEPLMLKVELTLSNEECEALERVLHSTEKELVRELISPRGEQSETCASDYALLSKVLRPVRQHITRCSLADARDREDREKAYARRATKREKGKRKNR